MMFTMRGVDCGRTLAGMLVVCAIVLALAPAASAQDNLAVPGKKTVADWLEDFFYYLEIGRWDLAAASGQKFLEEKPTADEVYRMLKKDRFRGFFRKLLKGVQVNEPDDGSTMTVAEVSKGILKLWNEGEDGQRLELEHILKHIEMLDDGERPYQLGIKRLRNSGLSAASVLVSYLTNNEKAAMRPVIERALGDLNRPQVVQPITTALAVNDDATKLILIRALRRLGFASALAGLQEVAEDKDNRNAVRAVAADAVARISRSPRIANTPADALYLSLANDYYNDHPALRADQRDDPTTIYTWDAAARSLTGRKCSLAIYMAVMAQRSCERALGLKRSEKAVTLWLSAVGLKDSIKAKVLADDPTATINDPGRDTAQGDAVYYYLSSGQQYLFGVLNRAISDGQLAVALRALKGLQNVATPAGLKNPASSALSRALRFPNRRIRVHAAFVGAAINPTEGFLGSEQVVPALGEALSRPVGRQAVLVLRADKAVNALKAELQKQALAVHGATSLDRALLALIGKPSVDVFFVGEKVGTPDVGAACRKIRAHARFGQSTIVILASAGTLGRFSDLVAKDKNLAVVAAEGTDAAGLVRAYRKAEAAAGRSPLTASEAKQLALRAAGYLRSIADFGNAEVFDATDAISALLGALEATGEADVRKAAGAVLARLDVARAQQALANTALDNGEDKAMRIIALDLLGESARRFGVLTDAASVAALVKLATEEADLAIRTPAGKAVGSMNLDSVQIADLILKFVQ